MMARVRSLSSFTRLALALVSLAYLLQVFTPLRLVGDGIDYLLEASSAMDGGGFRVHGESTIRRPPGYPALIVVLAKAGVGYSWAIVALNCLLLGVGCWASYLLLRRSLQIETEVAQFMCLMTLLSSVMIRHVTYPLSDISYFAASSICLLVLLSAETGVLARRFWRLIFVLPLIAFCIELRTVGITLIPVLMWATIGGQDGARKIVRWLWEHRLRSGLLLLGLLLLATVIIRRGDVFFASRYVRYNLGVLESRGILANIFLNLRLRSFEWGGLILNVSVTSVPPRFWPALQVVGFLGILVGLTGIWQKSRKFDSLICYVLGYGSVVLVCSWYDSRLWLPVVPFLLGFLWLGLKRFASAKTMRWMMVVYCTFYCLLGVLALAYSARLTLAGPRFPDLYGDGRLAATYRTAFRGETPANPNDIDPDVLYLLRRYEWRLATKTPADKK